MLLLQHSQLLSGKILKFGLPSVLISVCQCFFLTFSPAVYYRKFSAFQQNAHNGKLTENGDIVRNLEISDIQLI